jgi:probable rRNA maturation factor
VIAVGEHPSSNGIEIDNQTPDEIDEEAVRSLVAHHLAALNIAPDCELSISMVDEQTMTDLHVRWMDEQGPTDVWSFPMDELTIPGQGELAPSGVLGDIIVCPSFVRVQAEEKGRTLDEEVQFLITHGILHLLGLDHSEPSDEEAMFSLQDDLLNNWIRSTHKAGTA